MVMAALPQSPVAAWARQRALGGACSTAWGPPMQSSPSCARGDPMASSGLVSLASEDFLRAGRRATSEQEVHQLRTNVRIKEVDLLDARSTCHELRRQRDEDVAMCVARKAHLQAEEVSRHEGQLHDVVMRYERRLARAEGWTEPAETAASQRCAEEAQAAAATASLKADRYKQRAAKHKDREERAAKKIAESKALFKAQCEAAGRSQSSLLSRFYFVIWRTVVSGRQCVARWEEGTRCQSDAGNVLRLHLVLSCLLARWVALASASRAECTLRRELDEAEVKSTVAIAGLRTELVKVRGQLKRHACESLAVHAQLSAHRAFSAWCRVVATSRSERELNTRLALSGEQAEASLLLLQEELRRVREERRDVAVDAASSRSGVAVAAVFYAWAMLAKAAAHEGTLRRELGDAQSRTTLALRSAREESRALRRACCSHGLAAVSARALACLATALLAWRTEVHNLQAAKKLSLALEDAEFRHQRVLSVHRSQARSARQVAKRAGQLIGDKRCEATLGTTLRIWRSAVCGVRLERWRAERRFDQVRRLCLSRESLFFLSHGFDLWHVAAVAAAQGRASSALEEARRYAAAGHQADDLEEEIGRARRAGSRAGQGAARRAWSAWCCRSGDAAVLGIIWRLWLAEARHAAAVAELRRAAAAGATGTCAGAGKVDRDMLLEAEKLRTRAAGEVAQQAMILAWPSAPRQIGRLMHWRAAAFEAWWWAVVLPRLEIEDLAAGRRGADATPHSPSMAGGAEALQRSTQGGSTAWPRPPVPTPDARRRRSSRGPGLSGR